MIKAKIKKIFLTHAHGDHSFGLPGVLCLIGQSTQEERDEKVKQYREVGGRQPENQGHPKGDFQSLEPIDNVTSFGEFELFKNFLASDAHNYSFYS